MNYEIETKVHPKRDHEGPKAQQMNSSTVSFTSAVDGCGWSTSRPGRFIPEKGPVPIIQETEWAPGPVWTGAENLASTGIRSQGCPSRSKLLYWEIHETELQMKYDAVLKPGYSKHCWFNKLCTLKY